jgi:hypothetical protein
MKLLLLGVSAWVKVLLAEMRGKRMECELLTLLMDNG